MLKVGLTGNIGSGKSLIAGIFRTLEIPVFDADSQAKTVLNLPETRQQLRSIFGDQIFDGEEISRKALAKVVFNDKEKLEQINLIIHPQVRKHFETWTALHSHSPYLIYEAAIMIETGFYKRLDRIILVTANSELRISRVMQRDDVTREMLLRRMENQWDDQSKIPLADFVIQNNEDDLLIPQVIEIHRHLTGEI
jgi:dephospho-CoA kinase